MSAPTVESLIAALDQATDYSIENLEAILSNNLPTAEEIIALADASMPYGRTMLKLCDEYEVIIGCWPKHGWCDAHDHGEAIGVVYSYCGEIEHFEYRLREQLLELIEQSTIRTGESRRLESGMIHSLQNLTSEEPYIGLHIYIPPTKDVRVYDLHSGDIYYITDEAAAIIPKEDHHIKSVKRNSFSYRNLIREA